jgi:hypothetical protein
MIRFLIIAGAFVVLGILVWQLVPASKWKKCPRCDGRGFWRGTRGERNRCEQCRGEGRIPRS